MVTNTRRFAWITFGMVLLFVVVGSTARAESATGDDGWRRTAQGWESLTESRKVRSEQDSSLAPQRKKANLVPHPLLLAALQVTLIAAAYWRLPVKV